MATPDLGELRKKSTYMTNVDETTIVTSDQVDNIDDATWLYHVGKKVYDIYGNDGESAAAAYCITSSLQLLAFAKEVKNGNTFEERFVRLDADIIMQSSATAEDYQWKGIGEGSNVFNGTFLGGDRYINRLSGSSLFAALGEQACVEQLYITTIGSVANGALTSTNAGVIGGCKVIDDVNLTGESAGALVGTNASTGVIHACYYTGTGALVGNQTAENHGTIVGCYQASDITSFTNKYLEEYVGKLNGDLATWYTGNSAKYRTKFCYTFTPGNYPTVKVDSTKQ